MILQIVRVRSLYVSGIAEDDGSYRRRPLPQCLFGRGSLIHASQAFRPKKRGSPLPMGRTCTDSITLTLHPLRKCPPLRYRHILRGRAETRDYDRRCSAALHTIPHRLAERNRSVDTPLHLCRAYTLQGFSSSASTPSLKPLPPVRLTRPKHVAIKLSFNHPCQSRKDRHLSPDRRTVRLLPRLSACLLTLRKTERTMLQHRPF